VIAVGVAVTVVVAVGVAVAVGADPEGDSGSGSTIDEVVSPIVVVGRVPSAVVLERVRSIRAPPLEEVDSSSMVVFERVSSAVVVGRVPSTSVEGCVRSICAFGRLLPSNNLSSHFTPVTKAAIKATIVASTSSACNNPKKYLTLEPGLKTRRSA
jgi:hypothetical protein